MPKLSAMKETLTRRVLVYGPPKAGKTWLVGRMAEDGYNLYWFDFESGVNTLLELPPEAQERVNVFSIPDSKDAPVALNTALKVIRGHAVTVCETHGTVNCMVCKKEGAESQPIEIKSLGPKDVVVFDSATQLKNSAIANITKGKPDDYKLERDDWANLGKFMDMFFTSVQATRNTNIVVITHDDISEMNNEQDKLVPVGGTRNFNRNMGKYFDDVIYCDVMNGKHIAASSTTWRNKILTGSRSSVKLEKSSDLKLSLLWESAP